MMLSIIVPVYNVKNYLVKCLDSINEQTLTDYEVIVVDDGSTDGSGELLDAYCENKPKFHLYHKENGGLMSAWKYGVERAAGEYIGFVDSDDYVDTTMYQKLVSAAMEYSAEIALCNHYYVDESAKRKTLHRNSINPGIYTGDELEQIRGKMLPLLGKDYISPSRWSRIIHKNLLCVGGEYTDNRISSGEDVNSMVPCMLHCKSLVYIDEPLYYYVQRKNSISHVFKEELFDTYKILIENLRKAAEDCGLSSQLEGELQGLYNVYGLAWTTYIRNSSLKYRDKKRNFEKLTSQKDYTDAAKRITKTQGAAAQIYKASIKTKSLAVYLLGMKIKGFLYRVLRR